eukprot:CAMPEP_0179173852 /NCGR_PEP_ID=MMETSP0796-20121207/85812_1 /TAXON_ID=73915 /ORGANISM="Pyrodinium bahamense, Strain pbaha01" /LENGTH=30 /DNA_ID= /DNA_START= /DNA_END= /DNA_ORIENTATION=
MSVAAAKGEMNLLPRLRQMIRQTASMMITK